MFIQKGWHIHFGREPQVGNTQKRTQRANVDGTWTKGTMRASCLPEPWPNLIIEVCQQWVDASGGSLVGDQKNSKKGRTAEQEQATESSKGETTTSKDPTTNGNRNNLYNELSTSTASRLHVGWYEASAQKAVFGGVLFTWLWNRICSMLIWSFIILELFIFTHPTGKFEIKRNSHNATEASHDQLWSNWNEGGISYESEVQNPNTSVFFWLHLWLLPSTCSFRFSQCKPVIYISTCSYFHQSMNLK